MTPSHEKMGMLKHISQEINRSFVVQEGLVAATVLGGLVVTAVAVVSAVTRVKIFSGYCVHVVTCKAQVQYCWYRYMMQQFEQRHLPTRGINRRKLVRLA